MLIFIAVLILFVVLVIVRRADQNMQRTVQAEIKDLLQQADTTPSGTFQHANLNDIPAPVRRYLQRSVPDGYPLMTHIHLTQTGTMSTNKGQSWFPFEAFQVFTTNPPGFVWLARGRLMPFIWVMARDRYAAGHGSMLIKPMSLVTAADARGATINQGALGRYLAEAMWFPTSLLPDERLQWQAIDDHQAQATIRDGDTEFTATFTFNAEGDITQVEGLRYREDNGQLTAWGGKALAYREFDGVRIPSEVEVYWQPDGEYQPYYRGKITGVQYNPS